MEKKESSFLNMPPQYFTTIQNNPGTPIETNVEDLNRSNPLLLATPQQVGTNSAVGANTTNIPNTGCTISSQQICPAAPQCENVVALPNVDNTVNHVEMADFTLNNTKLPTKRQPQRGRPRGRGTTRKVPMSTDRNVVVDLTGDRVQNSTQSINTNAENIPKLDNPGTGGQLDSLNTVIQSKPSAAGTRTKNETRNLNKVNKSTGTKVGLMSDAKTMFGNGVKNFYGDMSAEGEKQMKRLFGPEMPMYEYMKQGAEKIIGMYNNDK